MIGQAIRCCLILIGCLVANEFGNLLHPSLCTSSYKSQQQKEFNISDKPKHKKNELTGILLCTLLILLPYFVAGHV
jgi:hypothetical protein